MRRRSLQRACAPIVCLLALTGVAAGALVAQSANARAAPRPRAARAAGPLTRPELTR